MLVQILNITYHLYYVHYSVTVTFEPNLNIIRDILEVFKYRFTELSAPF